MANDKKYWKGFDELNETPSFVEKRDSEFPAEVPVEEFMASEKVSGFKTDRRDFLKFLGFSVAAATLAACEKPVIKSVPYVNKPEDITPGVANWYASTYYDGNDYGSILVKTREGRPIMIKGNKYHGINGISTSPRMVASVLSLYNEARLNGPHKHEAEAHTDMSWADADAEIGSKLTAIAGKGGKIRLVTKSIISPSTRMAINAFTTKYGGQEAFPMGPAPAVIPDALDGVVPEVAAAAVNAAVGVNLVTPSSTSADVKHISMDEVSYHGIRKANEDSFGSDFIPSYNFAEARVIVSIGCDFLNGWLLSTEYTAQYGKTRIPENTWMSKHWQFESIMSQTGSNADVRVRIKPSQEGIVAAGILQKLGGQGAAVEGTLGAYCTKVAAELEAAKGKSLVVSGSNDPNIQIIVNAINEKLGNYGTTIDHTTHVQMGWNNDQEIKALEEEMTAGSVDAVIFYDVNPVYASQNGASWADAIGKCDLSVSFSQYDDETAANCQYICPDNHYLESWNDFNPKSGHYSLAQPVIRPLYDTRQAQESFLVWAGEATRSASKDSTVYYDFMQKTWNDYGYSRLPVEEQKGFDTYWNWAVHNGSFSAMEQPSTVGAFSANVSDAVTKATSVETAEMELVIYQKAGIGVGKDAANPWLQEMPDPLSKVSWDNYVTMAPADALAKLPAGVPSDGTDIDSYDEWHALYLGEDSPAHTVKVTVGDRSVTLPVFPMPGQASGTIGIAMGYGRGAHGGAEAIIGKGAYQTEKYGDYETDTLGNLVPVGANVFPLAGWQNDAVTYSGMAATVEATGETYPLACAQTHHTVMGRESVVKETTMSNFVTSLNTDNHDSYNPAHELMVIKNGEHVKVPVAEADLWAAHPVENVGHRWGMSVDLTSCIGCGTCLVSCVAENNVPVVGKDEVRRSRDMHWLRIDRYFSSIDDDKRNAWEHDPTDHSDKTAWSYLKLEVAEASPEVTFMPMMCQHCNHAPCETVCPVAATTHSNEGLNQMTYNRCIGTRYCANNCPYKVRRFNWFNYQGYKKFNAANPAQQELGRMVLNPDVVVRSRGVMEKCSFCVQKIQEGKLVAKKAGRPVEDGDVTSACAEACPVNAITFGDWNDSKSSIRNKSEAGRAYQSLEEVGFKPNVWYQAKVRNVDEDVAVAAHGDDHATHDEH
jgi:MoCo/4Fe-4S cofactor protein with predicted Tat translocation signal